MKKTELKVSMPCQKCKTEVLKAVAKLSGIDQVFADSEKGTVTVIGEVDPVLVAKQVRKGGKVVEIISVGPPKPPQKPPEAKPTKPPEKPPAILPLPPYPIEYQFVVVDHVPYDGGFCSIL